MGQGHDITWTAEGKAAVFIAVDYHSATCVGLHAARRATRVGALKPIRQDVRRCFGAFRERRLRLATRQDHESQYTSDTFQDELHFLGIASSPAFVRRPEGMAAPSASSARRKTTCCGWHFDTVEELR